MSHSSMPPDETMPQAPPETPADESNPQDGVPPLETMPPLMVSCGPSKISPPWLFFSDAVPAGTYVYASSYSLAKQEFARRERVAECRERVSEFARRQHEAELREREAEFARRQLEAEMIAGLGWLRATGNDEPLYKRARIPMTPEKHPPGLPSDPTLFSLLKRAKKV